MAIFQDWDGEEGEAAEGRRDGDFRLLRLMAMTHPIEELTQGVAPVANGDFFLAGQFGGAALERGIEK